MESSITLAGEPLQDINFDTTRITDDRGMTNYDDTNNCLKLASTGVLSITTKSKEDAGKSSKNAKDKVIIDVENDQGLSSYYFPKVGDMIIGKVINKYAFSYELDINAYTYGNLDALEFDGATKRNRPNLEPNTLVYCRVKELCKHNKPILSCISPVHKKAWTTGESYFGPLKEGYLCEVTKKQIKYLQDKNCELLNKLGEMFEFEIITG